MLSEVLISGVQYFVHPRIEGDTVVSCAKSMGLPDDPAELCAILERPGSRSLGNCGR